MTSEEPSHVDQEQRSVPEPGNGEAMTNPSDPPATDDRSDSFDHARFTEDGNQWPDPYYR